LDANFLLATAAVVQETTATKTTTTTTTLQYVQRPMNKLDLEKEEIVSKQISPFSAFVRCCSILSPLSE
jgi:hypothetical protein